MGVGIPERLQDELLEVVAEATSGPGPSSGAAGSNEHIEEAIGTALMLWARRGNPVSNEIDQMIVSAVRNTLSGQVTH